MAVQQFGAIIRDDKKFKRHIITVVLSALALAALAAIFLDQQISLFFDIPEIRTRYWLLAREITHAGLSEYYFGIAIITWLFGAFVAPKMAFFNKFKERVDFFRRWGLNFLLALIFSGIMTHLIKLVVGRQRPHKTPDFQPFIFDPITTHWHWHSFSSGHSQVVFTAATLFSIAFPALRFVWFATAILLCLTRVIIHDHFLSDIIFGACVGYVGSLLALRFMHKRQKNSLY